MRNYSKRRFCKAVEQSLAVGVMIGAELTRRFIQHARPPQPVVAPHVKLWPKHVPSDTPAYIASQEGDKFHSTSCRWAAQITAQHRREFPSQAAALAAGYSPCSVCQPMNQS